MVPNPQQFSGVEHSSTGSTDSQFLHLPAKLGPIIANMRRLLFIATSLLLVLPASAQMRSGGRGAPGVRPALASHRGMVANRGAFGHPGFSGVGFGTGFGGRFGRSSRGRFRHHHRFFGNTWAYGKWGYPIWGY